MLSTLSARTAPFSKGRAELIEYLRRLTRLSPDDLSKVIVGNETSIVTTFVKRAKAEVPAAADKSYIYVEDHLRDVLNQMADFLASGGGHDSNTASVWLADKHGEQRAFAPDYRIADLRREHRILNETILAHATRPLSPKAQRLYTEVFQLIVSHSTEAFVQNSFSEKLASQRARDERDQAREAELWMQEVVDRVPIPLFFVNVEEKAMWFSNRAARDFLGFDYQDEWRYDASHHAWPS